MAFALVSRTNRSTPTQAKAAHKNKLALQPGSASPQYGFGRLRSGTPATAFASTPVIQAKLKVGEPNDKFEREADRVADEVMRMPDRAMRGGTSSAGIGHGSDLHATNGLPEVQRLCTECATEEEKLQRTPLSNSPFPPRISALNGPITSQFVIPNQESVIQRQDMKEEDILQTKAAANSSTDIQPGIEARAQSLRGGGQPLSASERAFFEPRFGWDFSQVRIHADAQAAASARAINARAFTLGRDVVFGAREYAPQTAQGRRLLAHELTHTIQQTGIVEAKGLQRTMGDGHDLQSPRFAGDPVLEAVFDDERLLHVGNRGEAVQKIQQSLVDAGFVLPQFGVDGIFGLETRGVVKQFQTVFSLQIDGIVGPLTMSRLDEHYEVPNPPPVCPLSPPTETAATFVASDEVSTPPSGCQAPPGKPPGKKGCPTPSKSKVTGKHKAVDDFTGRSENEYGVGEEVKLFFVTQRSDINDFALKNKGNMGNFFGGARWVKISGPGNLTVTSKDLQKGRGKFTADEKADTVELELQVATGPCTGSVIAEVQFKIVRPKNVNITDKPGTAPNFNGGIGSPIPPNIWGAGFVGLPFISPTDVSFSRVRFREGEADAIVIGKFLGKLDKKHPVGQFMLSGPGNKKTGTPVITEDQIAHSRLPDFDKGNPECGNSLLGNSIFLWPIPWQFSVAGSPFDKFTFALHTVTATPSCDATIAKAGSKTFCRRLDGTDCTVP